MHQHLTTQVIEGSQILRNQLRHSPKTRLFIYYGISAASLQLIGMRQRPYLPFPHAQELLYIKVLPIVATLTYMGHRLQAHELDQSARLDSTGDSKHFLQGCGLGASAFLGWLIIAQSQGWIQAPVWGWECLPLNQVLRSSALFGLGQFAIACTEEMIFRGYGFDTLRRSVGPLGASGVSIALFALYHGNLNPQTLIGMVTGGVLFLSMRLSSGDIWLGLGYHWVWNFMQTGIFGPAQAEPSMRPLLTTGPYQWVGRPGSPEPGLLSMTITLGMALLVGSAWWLRNHRGKRATSACA